MKIKKTLIWIFSILIAFSTFSFFACNQEKKLDLDGWDNENKTVVLGSMYWIEKPEVIIDGVKYTVDVNVVDSKGETVILFKNTFDVLDVDGYKINFTVKVEDKVAEKTITLSVVDEKEPAISFANLEQGLVNTFFDFSQIIISDQSKKDITKTYKLYFISGDQRTEIACTQDGFLPTVAGYYFIEVTATDLSNNTCTKSTSFYIRNAIDNNEIETFSDYGANETNFAFDGSNFSGTKLKTHVSSFTRSSKSDYSICFNNNSLNNLVFVTEPRLDKDTLIELLNEEGNYISFYIYIDDENNASQEINYKNTPITTVKTNQWQEVIIEKEVYGDATNFLVKNFSGQDFVEIFNIANKNANNYTVYVDDIRIVDFTSNVTVLNTQTSYKLNDTITFNVAGGQDVSYELSFNGKTIPLSSTAYKPTATGKYTFIVEEKGLNNTGYDSYSFVVESKNNTFEISDEINTFVTGRYVQLGTATLNGGSCEAKYYFINYATGTTEEIVDGKIVKDDLVAGNYLYFAEITVGGETLTASTTIKLSEEEAKYLLIETPGLYYDYSDSFQGASSAKAYKEYLDEYENANGVWHVETIAKDAFVGMGEVMAGVVDKEYYQAHETMIFRVWGDRSASFIVYNDYPITGNSTTDCAFSPMTTSKNTWTYYQTDMSNVMKVYDKWQKRQSMIYSYDLRSLYFDEMFAANLLDVKSNSKLTAILGAEYTINDNIEEAILARGVNINGLKRTVLLNNNEIEVVNDKFVVDEMGYLEIIYTGYDDNQLYYFGHYSMQVKESLLDKTTGLYNDFSDSYAEVVGAKSGREWLSEFENAQGVSKFYSTTNDAFVLISSNATSAYWAKDYYLSHDKMVFRVYTDVSAPLLVQNDYGDGVLTGFTVPNDTQKVVGYWTDYEVSMSEFMKIWDRLQMCASFVYNPIIRTTYIDSIYAVKDLPVVSTLNKIEAGKTITISDNIATVVENLGVELYGLNLKVLLNNKELPVTNGTITPDEAGYLEFIYTATDENGLLYRGKYSYMIKDYRVKATTGLYNDFAVSFNSYSNNRSSREYLAQFNGANGVYKITSKTTNVNALLGASAITSYSSKEYIQAHDKVVFRVYTDIAGDFKIMNNYTVNTTSGAVVGNTGSGEWSDSIGTSSGLGELVGFTVQADTLAITNAWTEYEVSVADFMSIWDGLQNKTSYVSFDGARTIYFDSIYAVKTLNVVSNISTISKNQEVEVNDNIDEIISSLDKELYGLKLTILFNNEEVALTDNKFTVTEDGVLEFIYTAVDEDGLLYRGRYAYVIK